MTIQEVKNTPEIVDFMLDKCVLADSRMKLHKRLEEICVLAIKALEQTTWIPVSERLPKDEQEVLITYKINVKHHVWSAIWDELHCRFYDKKYRSYMSVDSVIAWMPLPEPYKPQESEE